MLTLTRHQRNESQNYAKIPALSQQNDCQGSGTFRKRGRWIMRATGGRQHQGNVSGHTRAGDCDRWNPEQTQGRQKPSMEVGLWGQNPSTNRGTTSLTTAARGKACFL